MRVAADRVISVHDPDARHVNKTVHQRTDGYKARLAMFAADLVHRDQAHHMIPSAQPLTRHPARRVTDPRS
jgi:hypothetical protein